MKRPCLGYPGHRCPRLIDKAGRCDECQRAVYATRNRNRPPGERQFYGSAEWKRLASAAVAAAEACATCGTPRYLTKLTGGHRIPIRQRPDLALEPFNVVAQCGSCQSRMKAEPDPSKWPEWARTPRGAGR